MKIRKAVFPAAGLGIRFLPATKASPKEMIPLVDKPLIQYVIEEAVAAGIEDIILVTGKDKRAIEDHFDTSFELEYVLKANRDYSRLKEVQKISNMVTLCYVRQKEALGLGHAILCAKDIVGNEPFAVLLGDDIIHSRKPCIKQMMDIYEKIQSSIIAVEKVNKKEVHKYGIIKPKKSGERLWEILDLIEKPKIGNAPSNMAIIGRYILTPEIFDLLKKTKPDRKGEIQLTDGLKLLLKTQKIYGYHFEGKRYDAGDKLGFLKATVEYALMRPDLGSEFRAYLKGLKL
ncbi:MAG TPA: UTP--glucose-1-phosphate uridylyltransferase GalU [Nitrospinota bacterium]|nr:UTP--glucose-1-phosphate uridylyltransferase GalU [Nitrospinota bacterium]